MLFYIDPIGIHVSIGTIFCDWCKEVHFLLVLYFQHFSAIFQLDKKMETKYLRGKYSEILSCIV